MAKVKKAAKAVEVPEVNLSASTATKLIKLAIKHEAYSDSVPKTTKDKIEAAQEIIAFCIDAWFTDKIRPDSDDSETAEAGEQIVELLAIAGIEIDDDDDIIYEGSDSEEDEGDEDDEDSDDDDENTVWEEDELIALNTADFRAVAEEFEVELPDGKLGSRIKRNAIAEILAAQDSDDEDEDGDDEAPVSIDDYIDGYDDLSPVAKIKAIKKLDLDEDDDDDQAVLSAIRDYEGEQDKPTSRVMNFIDELIGEVDDEDEEEDSEEPIEGYDEASVKEIKETLESAVEEDELTAENLEMIVEYEKENKNRTALIKWMNAIEVDSDDDEEEAEPAPKKRGKKSAKTSDPDDSDEVDVAALLDDDKFIKKIVDMVLSEIAESITS